MTEDHDDNKMRDFEIALMDSISTVFEILVAKNIVSAEVAAEMLRDQRDRYPAEQMPGAVFLMNCLIDRLTDPARAGARKLERDPPAGLGLIIRIGGSTARWPGAMKLMAASIVDFPRLCSRQHKTWTQVWTQTLQHGP